MDKRAVEKLKKELLNKKSHDIFKNVQALWDLAYATNDMELNYKVRSICAEKSQKYKKVLQKYRFNLYIAYDFNFIQFK